MKAPSLAKALVVSFGVFFVSLDTIATYVIPEIITATTTIELAQDILIDTNTELINIQSPFGEQGPDRVILSSPELRTITIAPTGTLNLTAFSGPNYILELSSQIILICQPGSKILLQGGVLLISQGARIDLAPA